MTDKKEYDDRKYIVTKIFDQEIEVKGKKYIIFDGLGLDTTPFPSYNPTQVLGEETLKIGDIVNMNSNGLYCKKQYEDCEKATVKRALVIDNIFFITAFCAKYGDITIGLQPFFSRDRLVPTPYMDTQRGDEIMIRQTDKDTYKIVTNLTIDKLRSDHLQKQK